MTRLEGNGFSRLTGAIFGDKRQPTDISLATVTTLPPNISIRIDGESIDTPSIGIVMAERLTQSPLSVGNRVIVAIANDGQLVYVLDKAVI